VSDTPRTDCEIGNVRSITPHLESEEYYRALAHRLSNFSRVLERELAAKDELIREAMEALEYISRECIVKGAERFMPCIRTHKPTST
jgi:hypothetical protein